MSVRGLSFSRTPPGLVEELAEGAGVDKIVWGSDALFLAMAHQIGKVLGARLSDSHKRIILSANARRILGKIRPAPNGPMP